MADTATCPRCGDTFTIAKCELCKANVHECPECHLEIAHNIIGPPMQSKSGTAQQWLSDQQYHGGYSE